MPIRGDGPSGRAEGGDNKGLMDLEVTVKALRNIFLYNVWYGVFYCNDSVYKAGDDNMSFRSFILCVGERSKRPGILINQPPSPRSRDSRHC